MVRAGSPQQFPAGDANLFNEQGPTTRKAGRVVRAEHDGPHTDHSISSFHIETRPKGAGKNLPSFADFSLTVSNIKQGWGSSTAQPGEIDGIYSVVRQGGPDATTGTEKSDAAAFLADAQSRGPVGFVTILEGSSSNLARGGALQHQIQAQLGGIYSVPADRGASQQIGLMLSAVAGVCSYGIFLQEGAAGEWDHFIRFQKRGGLTVFAVTKDATRIATAVVLMPNLPTDSNGLPTGALWVDTANGNVVKQVR